MLDSSNTASADWWRGCVIYQIYPRSFRDTNGDGIGDLPGIAAELEYVAALGVDAVWISPFCRSPMKDFGYDVSDYRDVDPMFGTLGDFDAIVARGRELGLHILIDQVLSHTSDQHPWFTDSRGARDAARADWYVWADPKPDGTAPNNWLSIFGGPAWQWEPRRRQYYLHNFLVSQPDLDFHNPQVTAQLLSDVEFWLQRGVRGFRLDVVNFYTHDRELRDNPPCDPDAARGDGLFPSNPYAYQHHVYDKTRPENVAFLHRLREVVDRYPGAATMGEIGATDAHEIMAAYTGGGDKLHMAYAFDLLGERFSAGHIRGVVETLEAAIGDGWPCWSLGNHDVTRVLTRWGGENPPPELAKLLMALLLSLRGSVCIYQGEELGLPEAEIPYDALKDPYGKEFWPEYKGRDGCRTPMPWRPDAPHAGFSTGEPWLPIPDVHRARAVSVQERDPGSVLAAYRRFLRWRREIPALRLGDIEFVDVAEPALGFIRSHAGERVLAVFNLSNQPLSVRLSAAAAAFGAPSAALDGHGFAAIKPSAGAAELPAYGVYFARLGGAV